MRYPSNSGVLWKVVFGFLCIIDTEQTAQIRWNTTGLRCLCLQFHSSRIPTVRACIFVAMYYSHPCRLAKSLMAKQNCSHRANVICDGSPSRIRMVRRISLGITTRPRSSMRRTIPVAFIYIHPPAVEFCYRRWWVCLPFFIGGMPIFCNGGKNM